MRGPKIVLALKYVVLLPGMITRLHLIRATDVAAVEQHVADQRPLAAAPQLDPNVEEPLAEDLSEHACLATLHKLVRLGDGTVRVLLEGVGRAQLSAIRADPDCGFTAQARPQADVVRDPAQVELMAERLRAAFTEYIQADPTLAPPLARLGEQQLSPGRLADLCAGNLTLQPAERLRWLEERVLDQRLRMALEGIEREQRLRKIKLDIDKEVQATMDKQQREFYLREQIRGLRKELGEASEPHDDAAALEQKLREAGMPEAGLEEALRELERMRRMHPDAAEYTVTRTWLEWLAAMPWQKTSPDDQDLRRAAEVLDADHSGLAKVKDRILEYLAVRTLKPDSKGPVLCFVGPPGVGKTSLGRSVGKALGRSFQRISLGGVKDEAEIRGHRRTYVGALPGRLAHALKRAGTKNPVIVLDEIDKMGKDFRGDPASALLEVLDPEQNHEFVDHYLDVPLDLSQVLFICTANQEDPIPEALADRLEVIELPGYILEEKLKIAQDHLLPRLRDGHGLRDDQISVGQPAVQHVVEAYTREAGVRGLDQKLSALHRKAARKLVEGSVTRLDVPDGAAVRELLGAPRHFIELAEVADQPGVGIGLAWTPSGGDILFIEVTSWAVEKGGGLKLTGQLGDVMKESAEAALSVVRSRSAALGLSPADFETRALHVHIPAGAVPKDGPSAGIILVTAIASLLTGRLLRPHLAMTGEVTLRGKVMPVGGVKEKVIAARRAGVKEVILPAKNENDLEDVPEALRRDLTFHFVHTVDEVLALGLMPLGA